MTKWMQSQSKEQRIDWAKRELRHDVDRRGRHYWYLRYAGLGNQRITAERAREKLSVYGLTPEEFLA